jgi:hypothetical protein
MIVATYFSKKLGYPVIPELVARNAEPQEGARALAGTRADRRRATVAQ